MMRALPRWRGNNGSNLCDLTYFCSGSHGRSKSRGGDFTNGPALFFSQVQTRSADEPMTTFVLCNECGNRWKVCMSVSFFLSCHSQVLPNLSSSRPTAPNQGRRRGLPACTQQVCRAGDSGALLGRQGQKPHVCA